MSLIFGLAAASPAPCSQRPSDIEGFHGAFGPSGIAALTAPTLKWEVWAIDGESITSFSMEIDGQKVDAAYNASAHLLSYTPTESFSPGTHTVKCTAVVEKLLKMTQSWSFSVSSDSPSAAPQPSEAQMQILQEVNLFRQQQGLPAAEMNPYLAAAAQAHSHYLAVTNSYGHFETPGLPGYIGNTLGQRLNAFGWTDGGYEDVGFESHPGTLQTVSDLFAAPYHRIPFLQPGSINVGAGSEDRRTTIEFAFTNKSELVCSPSDQASNVPPKWDGSEIPSPMRLFPGASGPYGYPVMVAGFGVDQQIVNGKISLYDAAQDPVPCMTASPKTDKELRSALYAIPKTPLTPGRYTARAVLWFSSGTTKELSWSFSVGTHRS